jgi:hypothetical protein
MERKRTVSTTATRSIYDAADEVQVRDRVPRDPYLDDRERGECRYKLKFISAFSKGVGESENFPAGFFKTRYTVLESEGLSEDANPYPPNTDVTIFTKPRKFNAHVKDIKRQIAALTNTPVTTVSKSNIDEVAADDPNSGGAGEFTGVTIQVDLRKNDRGFLDMHFKALPQTN